MKQQLDEVIQYSQKMTLLYVEDNPDAREMTAMLFEELFGKVVMAASAEEGLRLFEAHSFDMIVTDITLSELSGIEMLREIRKQDSRVSMVILSAYGNEDYLAASIKIGVDGYLKKPIEMDAFLELISRIAQKHHFDHNIRTRIDFLEAHQQATSLGALISKTDPKGIITYVNDAFCEVSGYAQEELVGKNHNIVRHPDNPSEMFEEMWRTIKAEKKVWRGVVRNRAKDGKSYYVDSLIMPILDPDGNVIEYISPRNNITDIMQPSRQLQSALKQFHEHALLYLKMKDYDIFEGFYDTETLERIQEKLAQFLQKKISELYTFDRVYALGNGEFALLIIYPDYYGKKGSDTLLEDELTHLQTHLEEETISLGAIHVRASLMISLVYENDRVLESAKLGIKKLIEQRKDFIVANRFASFEQARARDNMKMVRKIREAIDRSRIVSYFQPVIDNQTGDIVKYESLVRLKDAHDEIFSPFDFLETSKRCGCYPHITEKVLQNSFAILKQTEADISINLSITDIEHRPTCTAITDFLKNNMTLAPRIIFELLEDEMTRDYQHIYAFATQVKMFGARIAIDDFGAGYSNYERLLSYRPDILKIDGSLIHTLAQNTYSLSIVKSIVTFAKEQNLKTVAEFVENDTVFQIVKELGIDYSQGYLFGKPQQL